MCFIYICKSLSHSPFSSNPYINTTSHLPQASLFVFTLSLILKSHPRNNYPSERLSCCVKQTNSFVVCTLLLSIPFTLMTLIQRQNASFLPIFVSFALLSTNTANTWSKYNIFSLHFCLNSSLFSPKTSSAHYSFPKKFFLVCVS